MVDWRSQFPNPIVTRRDKKDFELTKIYEGEVRKILYRLKNLMSFQNLKQLRLTSVLTDGTVITATSIYGHDFIDITLGAGVARGARGVPAPGSCVITFINLPSIVQPMKNPRVVLPDEVAGIDYIKTYYILENDQCEDCEDVSWSLLFEYAQPYEPRHYWNPITQLYEPNNHMVYSLYPPAWAGIIENGEDSGGKYIIWKAYTEGENQITRTGLAVLLIKAESKIGNAVICSNMAKLDVDCCQKDISLRQVEIWWEAPWCQPFMQYGDRLICKVPNVIDQSDLRLYSLLSPYDMAPLYSIPDIKGGCVPMEWTLVGPGELRILDGEHGMHTNAYFVVNRNANCLDHVTITVKDRCGNSYVVSTTDVCPGPPLSVGYSTLQMQCSDSQNLSASGGTGPYNWSLSGGGSISQSEDGSQATYTSPASNAGCAYNPTITVTDCCGQSASIDIAVNCYAGDDIAFKVTRYVNMGRDVGCGTGGEASLPRTRVYIYTDNYRCDSTLFSTTGPTSICLCRNDMPECIEGACTKISGCGPPWCETGVCCDYAGGDIPCNGFVEDVRTEAMIANGCCPLNPGTGEPF